MEGRARPANVAVRLRTDRARKASDSLALGSLETGDDFPPDLPAAQMGVHLNITLADQAALDLFDCAALGCNGEGSLDDVAGRLHAGTLFQDSPKGEPRLSEEV